MNKYFKSFIHRGLIFAGFGPIVAGTVYMTLEKSINNFSLSGSQVFLAIVSTYLLAFLQAGASVFNQIETWSVAKSLLCHFMTLYSAYTLCYLLNNWIPFKSQVLIIFTLIFAVLYFIIWAIVYFSIKTASKKMNKKLS